MTEAPPIPNEFEPLRGVTEPLGTVFEKPENQHGVVAHPFWSEWREALVALRADKGPTILITRRPVVGTFVAPIGDFSLIAKTKNYLGFEDPGAPEWVPGGREESVFGRMPWQTDLINWRLPVGTIIVDQGSVGRLLAYLLQSSQDNPATSYQVGSIILDHTLANQAPKEVDAIYRLGRKSNCTMWVVGDESAKDWRRFAAFQVLPHTGKMATIWQGDAEPIRSEIPTDLATEGRQLIAIGKP